MEITDGVVSRWRLTSYYGFPERGRRRDSWALFRSLRPTFDLPWCCFGDFNDMLSLDNKKEGVPQPEWLHRGLDSVLKITIWLIFL